MGRFERMWIYVIPIMVVGSILAWFFRYDVQTDQNAIYRFDRWTGKVQRCPHGLGPEGCGSWR